MLLKGQLYLNQVGKHQEWEAGNFQVSSTGPVSCSLKYFYEASITLTSKPPCLLDKLAYDPMVINGFWMALGPLALWRWMLPCHSCGSEADYPSQTDVLSQWPWVCDILQTQEASLCFQSSSFCIPVLYFRLTCFSFSGICQLSCLLCEAL